MSDVIVPIDADESVFLGCRACGAVLMFSDSHVCGSVDAGNPDIGLLIRNVVNQEMRHQGLTQTKLAQTINCSQKHLSQLLNGKSFGSITIWNDIVAALNVGWVLSLSKIDD